MVASIVTSVVVVCKSNKTTEKDPVFRYSPDRHWVFMDEKVVKHFKDSGWKCEKEIVWVSPDKSAMENNDLSRNQALVKYSEGYRMLVRYSWKNSENEIPVGYIVLSADECIDGNHKTVWETKADFLDDRGYDFLPVWVEITRFGYEMYNEWIYLKNGQTDKFIVSFAKYYAGWYKNQIPFK